jgi:hypothetical protein
VPTANALRILVKKILQATRVQPPPFRVVGYSPAANHFHPQARVELLAVAYCVQMKVWKALIEVQQPQKHSISPFLVRKPQVVCGPWLDPLKGFARIARQLGNWHGITRNNLQQPASVMTALSSDGRSVPQGNHLNLVDEYSVRFFEILATA